MNKSKIKRGVQLILEGIGENLQRPGLKETPGRVAAMYTEICGGMKYDSSKIFKTFKEPGHEEMVMVKDIPFYSICEHHLLPMIGKASVAYIPDNNIITGISKLARIVDVISRRPQLQERITTEIARAMVKNLKPKGVIVIIEAEHLCMTMRGIKKPGSVTVTSAVRGIFREDQRTRAEAMVLMQNKI